MEVRKMEQPKWRSPVVWGATIANIASIVGLFWPTFEIGPWVQLAGVIVVILVQFGILNNPNNKTGFGLPKK